MKSMADLLKEAKRRKAAESANQSIPASASSSSSSSSPSNPIVETILSLAEWKKIEAFNYHNLGVALRFSNSEKYESGDGYNLESSPYSDRDEYATSLLTTIEFTQSMISHKRSDANVMLLRKV